MLRAFRSVLLLVLVACTVASEPDVSQLVQPAVTTIPPVGVTATSAGALMSDPAASPSALPPGTFVNPVIDADFPNPSVMRVGKFFYAYATNTPGVNIQVARSEDLVHWEWLGEGLPKLPDWALQANEWTWSPDVAGPFPIGYYIMYFTTRFAIGRNGSQCIGIGTSQEPTGPFAPFGDEPLICFISQGGAKDADWFVDLDGNTYLLWKSDGIGNEWRSGIYIQSLSKDGLRLEGEPTWLFTYDLPWEGSVVEGPVLWKQDEKYYLFYSANDFRQPYYAVGVAVADSPQGPYRKMDDPILKTDLLAGIVSPGGQDLIRTPSGETWIFFHSRAPGGYRQLNLAHLSWEDGRPVVDELSRGPMEAPVVSNQ